MGEQQRKPRTAAEEVGEEIRRAETEDMDGGADEKRDGESADALTTNVGAQEDARGDGRDQRDQQDQ